MNKKILLGLSLFLISLSYSCAVQNNISPTAPDLLKNQPTIVEVGPVAPKLRIKVKEAQIEVAEQDLDNQIKAILDVSEEKRIKDVKLSVVGNNIIRSEGIFLQKIPLATNPLEIPFTVEGTIKAQPQNIIEFQASKIKFAGISVKSLMDVLGIELANITKFKDSAGRVEVKGNNFLFIVDKFSNNAIMNNQIKSVVTTDKTVTVTF